MEDNDWVPPDTASIADVVWDIQDNPEVKAIVDFMPFSVTPVQTEPSSFGGWKFRFR